LTVDLSKILYKGATQLTIPINMATENEKLCMAIILNSSITNIDWKGVAADLGLEKINSARMRWYRFKSAKFGPSPRPTKEATAPATQTTPSKGGKNAGKKRGLQEMSEGDDEIVRRTPARKAKEKKVKLESLGSDEDGDEDGMCDEKSDSETENGVSKAKEDYIDDVDSKGTASEA
jgi:hypothetical protein